MDQNQKPAAKIPNIWLVVSIVLAIALVGVLAANVVKKEGGDEKGKIVVVEPEKAGGSLLDFINKVYGPQVGTATLKEVTEENGLYKVSLTVVDNTGAPVEQTVFLTRDAKLFIPQAIDIESVLAQFDALQQQQQPAVNTNAASEVPAEQTPSTQENLNVNE